MQPTYVRPGDRVRIPSAHAARGRSASRTAHRSHDGFDVFAERVRWTPVVVGMLCALTMSFLLASLGAAIGASAALDRGRPVTESGLWAVLSGLAAFLIGGYVAGRLAHAAVPGSGAAHGALVFMLAVPVVLWLASQGARSTASWFGGVPGTWTALVALLVAFVALLVAFIASAIGGWLASAGQRERRPR